MSSNPFGDDPNPYQAPGAFPGKPPMNNREAALSRVKVPAIILMVMAPLWMAFLLVDIGFRVVNLQSGAMPGIQDPAAPGVKEGFIAGQYGGMVGDVVGFILQIVVIVGAYNMMTLKNRSLALAANIISCIPCFSFCCVIGIPIGVWGLMTINDPAVKSCFES